VCGKRQVGVCRCGQRVGHRIDGGTCSSVGLVHGSGGFEGRIASSCYLSARAERSEASAEEGGRAPAMKRVVSIRK
jgi:hypothetical protein